MSKDIVFFAHGKESGPWGTKIKKLAKIAKKYGCQVESPDYSWTMDPDERVRMLLKLKPKAGRNLILVGSSMGGYVSAVASKYLKVKGLFLMAPAFFRIGYKIKNPKPKAKLTLIVHGINDELIPVEHSFRYAKEHKTELYVVDSDHRLASALPIIEKLFEIFLKRIL
ncbi:MAG: hypothetical protein A2Z88_03120 [Omnitrophica WOR_2 bacterium GWA2_47_8]|nr:MAG: hypothetical protein A2Z88_03120 [Omnitrophica WOR_2 bacterium GWA2_47_8]